ncbi:hypothetical protein LWC35_12090 [Pseudonocardia kujensis]|uniref:hypothetical protein n=1 Tax=Pseudonocardia kujensis TaxID=1128675 RepID=UPI001E4A4E93|nr:hypothetical protein [Pseudonocardia kujensis]MCE0763639.1 hypothetical protein [Pseudonocardia kujensis]
MSITFTRTARRTDRPRRRWNPFRLEQFRPAAPFGGILPADRDRERVLADLRALGAPGDLIACAHV